MEKEREEDKGMSPNSVEVIQGRKTRSTRPPIDQLYA